MTSNVGAQLKSHMVHLGTEDRYKGVVLDEKSVLDAYNWYNYFCEADDSKKYTLTWLKEKAKSQKNTEKMDMVIRRVNATKDYNFRTLGWICRMLSNGTTLPKRTLEFRDRRLAEIVKAAAGSDTTQPEQKQVGRTTEERFRDSMNDLIGELEVELDRFSESFKGTFVPFDFLVSKNVKAAGIKEIIAFYKPVHAELSDAIRAPDAQLKEGYRKYSKSELKKIMEFVATILTDCNRIMENLNEAASVKKTRKPRRKKVKTPEQLTSKLKYLASSDKYGVTSIPPKDIVKSTQLWVFNAKTRELVSYIASDVDGLSVKGSTVLNYDEKLSVRKKLRKPEETLKEIINAGKVTLRKIMSGIKTKDMKPSGRINKDTLLVKMVK